MSSDGEKVSMLERAQALDTARKTALEIVKHLTTLEIRSLSVMQEETARNKLTDSRLAHGAAVSDLETILHLPVAQTRAAEGPLFDAAQGAR